MLQASKFHSSPVQSLEAMVMPLTESLFLAYCQCAYKAFLKSKGELGEPIDYELIQTQADASFKDEAIMRLVQSQDGSQILREPASLKSAIRQGFHLILGARFEALGVAHKFDLLERLNDRDDSRSIYVPVKFTHREKLTREDLLLAAFHGIILAEALSQSVPFTKVVHGFSFSVTKIKLVGPTGSTRIAKEARQTLERLRKQIEATLPPIMILNSH
jgi:hypothetical protein